MSPVPHSAATPWPDLLTKPRLQPSFGRLEAVVLGLYTLVLFITLPFHEPWCDEAQAWLIARSSGLGELFLYRLHYEGTPGLWHLILWTAARLHLPYASMNWISAAFAVGGVYLLLRYSPFPTLIRCLLPFTFWLQYQYAVIARQYSLTPLFAFALCAVFTLRKPRPLLFALLAGLLANLSLYAALWAGALTLLYLPVLWAGRSTLPRPRIIPAALVLGSLFFVAFYTALPATDIEFPSGGTQFFNGKDHPWMKKVLPPTPSPAGWETRPPARFDLNGESITIMGGAPPDTTLFARGNAVQRAIIRATNRPTGTYKQQTSAHRLAKLLVAASALLFGISSSNLLGLAFLLIAFVWLLARRSLRFTLPLVLMVLFAFETWVHDHHTGLFFLALLSAFWLAWPRQTLSSANPRTTVGPLTTIFSVIFLLVILQQIGWSAKAVVSDIRRPYDPGLATARYLQQNAQGKRVLAYPFLTVAAKPYLPPNPFFNQPFDYWIWSSNVSIVNRIPLDLAQHPDILVTGAEQFGTERLDNQLAPQTPPGIVVPSINPAYLAAMGYTEKARICGDIFMRGGNTVTYCNIISVPESGISHAHDEHTDRP